MERSVINKLLGGGGGGGGSGLNWFHAAATLGLDSAVVHKHTSCLVRGKDFYRDFYSSMHRNSEHINWDSSLRWNKTSTQQQDQLWNAEATKSISLTRWARPKYQNLQDIRQNYWTMKYRSQWPTFWGQNVGSYWLIIPKYDVHASNSLQNITQNHWTMKYRSQ